MTNLLTTALLVPDYDTKNTIIYQKKPGLIGDMVDSRSSKRNRRENLKTFCHTKENKKIIERLLGMCL